MKILFKNMLKKLRNFNYLSSYSLIVVIPSILLTVYFSLIHSNVYITESKFIVRAPQQQTTSSIGMLLRGTSFARAQDDAYTVQDYLKSRDAIKNLSNDLELIPLYSSNQIDFTNRFGLFGIKNSFEDFYKYFSKRVTVSQNSYSSITTLKVKAYDPNTSQAINNSLLISSEKLVNAINNRAREDLISFAKQDVEDARKRAEETAMALASYRNKNRIVDPDKQSIIQLQIVSKLQDELIKSRMMLRQLEITAPNNPQIASIKVTIDSIEEEIKEEIFKTSGAPESLASQSPKYQRLIAQNIFSEKQLQVVLSSLDGAINEARKQQFYLERIVDPLIPDKAIEPRRLFSILSVIILSHIFWALFTLLAGTVREHNE
jgi:capsular polysaccharide transport system permease protein